MLIPTTKNVKTITDMRENALGLLADVQKLGVAYIFHRSKPKAVIMRIDEYAALQKGQGGTPKTRELVKAKKTKAKDFWVLGGSLRSSIKLSDKQLREARNRFSKEWARND